MRIAFIVMFGLLLAACASAPLSPDAKQCASWSAADEDRIAACTREINSGRLSPEEFGEALRNRGQTSLWRDLDHAIADFSEIIRLNPKDVRAFHSRGDAWRYKGDYDRAIVDYTEVIRLDPKDHAIFNDRGVAWSDKGDLDRAIADYTAGIRIRPFPIAYFNRGNAWRQKGDYDKAIADYTESIRLYPDAETYAARGQAWASKGDFGKANSDYTEAIRLERINTSSNYLSRGITWTAKGDYDKAIAAFTEAIRLNSQDALTSKAFYSRGILWSNKGDYDRAIADYNEAIILDPKNAQAHNGVAWLLATAPAAQVRNGMRAVDLAQKACELTEWKEPNFIDTLAAAYAEVGNFSEAIRWQEKALAFPEFAKNSGDEARARLTLFRQRKPYRDLSSAAKAKGR